MKKKICLFMLAASLILSACNGNVNVNTASDESKKTEENTGEVPEEEENAGKEEAQAVSENKEPESSKLPVYKLIIDYNSSRYEGKEKEDGEGNPLEGKLVFDGLTEAVMVSDESRDLYPELYKSLNEASAASLDAASANAKGLTEQAQEDADTSKADGRPFYGPYTDYMKVTVARSDEKILSFTEDYTSYMGGAHGMYGRSGHTYDVATGKKLKLTDVVDTTEDKLIPVLKEKIYAVNDKDEYDDLDTSLADYRMDSDTVFNEESGEYTVGYNWYLDMEGVHFYFGPYEIASYAIGATDVVIPYDEFPGKVNEKYLPDDNTGYIVNSDIPMTGSKWDDKNDKSLHFVYETEDDESDWENGHECTALTLRKGDKSATAKDEYFTFNYDKDYVKQYRVVTKDGREYIYVCALTFNDYTDVMVFDINDDDIKLSGVFTCHLVYDDSDPEYPGEFLLTDPENMIFAQVGNLFGTYTCSARYVVAPDGMPQFSDTDYKVRWGSDDAVSKKDVKVTLLDKDFNEQGEETIKAGTHFRPVKTDNETYMDLRLDDGRLVRLKYTGTDFPAKIDNESVDDLFDGLVYAG